MYISSNANCFAIGVVLVGTKVTWVNLELSVEKLVPRGYMVYSVRYHISYVGCIFQVFLQFFQNDDLVEVLFFSLLRGPS